MRRREKKNVYRSQENIRHDSWDIYSRTGGIRNDYDNNTADHNGCGSGPGNYDNAIFALYHISGRKEPPAVITYLGKVLPCAVIGLLVVFCLKDVPESTYY